jgi:hypothetical protein
MSARAGLDYMGTKIIWACRARAGRNNDKNKNAPMTKTKKFQQVRFGHFVIWYSNLFRTRLPSPHTSCSLHASISGNGGQVSDFDIRILPEHDFSFRHYVGL